MNYKQKKKPLLMFDFDGVIVDTLIFSYSINQEADTSMTLPEYQKLFSGNIYTAVDEHMQKNKLRGHPNFHGRYAERSREIKVPEEIRTLLRKLAERFTLSIVSGSATFSIQEILTREEVADCFTDILGYDVATDKRTRIKMLLKKYGVKPDDTAFITDTAGDVREATECEVPSIAVTWGFQDKETLGELNPMAIVETVEQLDSAIELFFEQ